MNVKKMTKELRRAKKFAQHQLLEKYATRVRTTKLLLLLINKGSYISTTLLHGEVFEIDNIKIANQLFLKTLNRE